MNLPTRLALAVSLALPGGPAQADEKLLLTIATSSGEELLVEHRISETDGGFASGALGRAASRQYQAIRCDGPWGAQKYRLTLASGPGYQLELDPGTILLSIVEHDVISEDSTIEAMQIHCRDMEPQPVVRSVAKIWLERGRAVRRELALPNGYRVLYSYRPDAND